MSTAAAHSPNRAPVDALARLFGRFGAASGERREPAWLTASREEAWARFEEHGLPTTRQEAWRFTSLAPLARLELRLPEPEGLVAPALRDALAELTFGGAFEGHQAVFVNGRLVRELSSLPGRDGLTVLGLREALEKAPELVRPRLAEAAAQEGDGASILAALNGAFLEDGAVLSLPAGAVVTDPIHLVFLSSPGRAGGPTMSHPRNLILLGPRSQATVIESYGGRDAYLTNAVTQVRLDEGAVLDHYKVQRESTAAFHLAETTVRQGRSTSFTSHSLALGAALARNDIGQVFAGPGGECVLNGLFMVGGRQHTDTHTWVNHAEPHCSTRELYKGVLDGESRGVFVGKIRVGPGAQKTDAQQTNRNLLLSRQALVDSVPQLEILADDVKCKHGSTTGQLDPTALFYLRSRGIGEELARNLLIYAFASDVVERLKPAALRAGLTRYLQERLPGAPIAEMKGAVL